MKSYLGQDRDRLIAANSLHTAQEIAGQADVWSDATTQIEQHRQLIDEWLEPQLAAPETRIVLCGAGSSSFIGKTLAPWLSMKLRRRVEAIATTDLVGNPAMYMAEDIPTLMVSFSRSGDSPESVASIDLANRMGSEYRHLALTCNRDGHLAKHGESNPDILCLRLLERACDRGFAMTASFTTMLVSCAAIFTPDLNELARAIASSRFVIARLATRAQALAEMRFERLVVLGAGCLRATASEACLKVLELTNGAIIPVSDTPLGFRHGPKCVIDSATCIVLLVSGDAYTARYDLDLLREIDSDARAGRIIVIHGRPARTESGAGIAQSPHPFTPDTLAQLKAISPTEIISVAAENKGEKAAPSGDFWLSLPYLVFCQMFAFFKARGLDVEADDPCPTGEVNRVVQGVTIHPYAG